jgi:hypothetical protein
MERDDTVIVGFGERNALPCPESYGINHDPVVLSKLPSPLNSTLTRSVPLCGGDSRVASAGSLEELAHIP